MIFCDGAGSHLQEAGSPGRREGAGLLLRGTCPELDELVPRSVGSLGTWGLPHSRSYLCISRKPPIRPQYCQDDKHQGRTRRETLTRAREVLFLRRSDLRETCLASSFCKLSYPKRVLPHSFKNIGRWNNPKLTLCSCITERSKRAHCRFVHSLRCHVTYP